MEVLLLAHRATEKNFLNHISVRLLGSSYFSIKFVDVVTRTRPQGMSVAPRQRTGPEESFLL
jgi:hypothetical protein